MSAARQRPVWQDAYDAQMGLWRWYRTPGAAEWLGGLYREAIDGSPSGFKQVLAQMYDAEMGRLVECDPFYVAPEMVEMIDAAHLTFQPETLHQHDLLSPRGFLYFARPVSILDKHDRALKIRAFAWSQQFQTAKGRGSPDEVLEEWMARTREGEAEHGPRYVASELDAMAAEGFVEAYGIQIGLYCDTADYIDTSARAHDEGKPGAYERSLANMRRMTTGTPLVPAHIAPWNYEMTYQGNEVDVLGDTTGAIEWWRLLQTTFRLMQQRRPHVTYERPSRASRREWQRLGGRPDTEVVIVRLRREEPPRQPTDENGEGRSFSHRFLRTGHWRNQWYPSVRQHRQIWIHPTVVGDESLPLIVRPRRVFQWTR